MIKKIGSVTQEGKWRRTTFSVNLSIGWHILFANYEKELAKKEKKNKAKT